MSHPCHLKPGDHIRRRTDGATDFVDLVFTHEGSRVLRLRHAAGYHDPSLWEVVQPRARLLYTDIPGSLVYQFDNHATHRTE